MYFMELWHVSRRIDCEDAFIERSASCTASSHSRNSRRMRAREKNHVRMRFGVVGKQMAARDDFANQIRTSLNEAPHQEKSCTRLVALEQVEQIRRNARIGSVVEGQCNLANRATIGQVVNRLTENLRGWRDGRPTTRANARSGDQRRTYGPRIQINTLSGPHIVKFDARPQTAQERVQHFAAALLS